MRIALDKIEWDYLSEQGRAWLNALKGSEARGEVIHSMIRRDVCRLAGGVIVKEIRYSGLRSLLKAMSGGNARKEGRTALALGNRGAPAPRVLAFGAERHGGLLRRDVLITKEVENAIPLLDFFQEAYPHLPLSARKHLIRAFASFIRKLHDVGAYHKDLHPGNILIQKTEGGALFSVLDLDRVRLHQRGLSKKERLKNLGYLLRVFWTETSLTERFRFMKYYGLVRDEADLRDDTQVIEKSALRNARRLWKKRANRCRGNNSAFVNERSGTFRVARLRRSDVASVLHLLLPDPDKIMEKGRILKDGRTVKASEVRINGRPYFLKRYNPKAWGYQAKNIFRRSRAVRTWSNTWGFRLRGIPVPEPLICLEERRYRILKRSFILSEFITDARSLRDICPKLDESRKKSIRAKLAVCIGMMHRFGAYHGDLRWNNILVQLNPEGEKIVLGDLDGSRLCYGKRLRKSLRDLERFFVEMDAYCRNGSHRASFVSSWRKWSGQSAFFRLRRTL
jgi:tRNA A-37 threonylcarbamoyl transferase component Bud32